LGEGGGDPTLGNMAQPEHNLYLANQCCGSGSEPLWEHPDTNDLFRSGSRAERTQI
jgi:hypothetical protein